MRISVDIIRDYCTSRRQSFDHHTWKCALYDRYNVGLKRSFRQYYCDTHRGNNIIALLCGTPRVHLLQHLLKFYFFRKDTWFLRDERYCHYERMCYTIR